MNLASKKAIAAKILKVGVNRVWFDPDRLDEIKDALTKADIRKLIKDFAIQAKPVKSISRGRARKKLEQKRKGRRKGPGSRKGKRTARLSKKRAWIQRARPQREFIKMLREKGLITKKTYRMIYAKIKGGFFRSKRHIKLYLNEHNLFVKK